MEITIENDGRSPAVGYAGPATRRADRGSVVGRAVLIGLNVISLLASGVLTMILGDAYAPFFGLIVGVPLAALTGVGVTLPSVVFGLRRPPGRRGIMWLGIASLAVAGTVTTLLICLPSGSGC